MNFNQIVRIVKEECNALGVKFHRGRGQTVQFGEEKLRTSGYFYDGETEKGSSYPILAIATNPNSLTILVHEYCHMQQWIDQDPVWTKISNHGQIWDWVEGMDGFSDDELNQSAEAYYQLELDCEKRAIKKHIQWKTGINLTEYIQKSNAYTMFYFYMREHRVWYSPGKEPYNVKKVWSAMPKTFDFNREKWYNKVHKLYDNCI